MRALKVVQVAWNWVDELGGAALSVYQFAKVFDSLVVSFTQEPCGTYSGGGLISQIQIPYSNSMYNRYSYSSSPLKKQAEKELAAADLIICHGFYRYHFDWAVAIARRNNIPYWIVPHGSLDPFVFTYRKFSKFLWFALKGNKGFADAGAIVFSTEAERTKASLRIAAERSEVIHWPVEYVATDNRLAAKSRIRTLHNIPIDASVLLYIARFHPSKRPIETIKAVTTAGQKNVYLLMVGPDSDVMTANDCKDFCAQNGAENVRFIEPVYGRGKFDYFMAADAFISLSHKENFGFSLAEALAAGIPVILSPGNDLVHDICHLNCGWLLVDDHLESAIKAVVEFAATPEKQLIEMGLRGQEWARTELSLERFKSQLRALALETVATTGRQIELST